MAIKESALSLITSIAQSDFVRVVTSAGASRKVTVAKLSEAILADKVPTAASVGASAGSVSTHTFNVPTGSRGFIFIGTTTSASWAVLYFNCPSSGIPVLSTIANGTGLASTSTGTNQFSLNFSSNVRCNFWAIPLVGGSITITT